MFEHTHPAYQHWLEWGKEVRTLHDQGVIRGLVFVSAHWQAEDLSEGVYRTFYPSTHLSPVHHALESHT